MNKFLRLFDIQWDNKLFSKFACFCWCHCVGTFLRSNEKIRFLLTLTPPWLTHVAQTETCNFLEIAEWKRAHKACRDVCPSPCRRKWSGSSVFARAAASIEDRQLSNDNRVCEFTFARLRNGSGNQACPGSESRQIQQQPQAGAPLQVGGMQRRRKRGCHHPAGRGCNQCLRWQVCNLGFSPRIFSARLDLLLYTSSA